MKTKIFQALKTKYSHLGLGDEILTLQAGALAGTGLVTDDNLDAVINAQSEYLAGLQKQNDRRANEAAEKAKKAAEEEAAKRAEEARVAAEEAAKKKAEEEAEAKRKAEEEAKRKAEEDAKKAAEEEAKRKAEEEEKRKQEEIRKNKEIPDWWKEMNAKAEEERKQREEEAKKREEEYNALFKKMNEESAARQKQYEEQFAKMTEANKTLSDSYEAMKKEAEDAKSAKAAAERKLFIENTANELGIPEWRQKEGFVIAPDATNEAIKEQLSVIANNVKTNILPGKPSSFPIAKGEATPEELKEIAKSIIHN